MRGEINFDKRSRQIVKFSGLRYGNITPTDIDGFLDFGNRLFVFIETKSGDTELPYGQRLAIERLCDACQDGGVASVAIVARHNEPPENDIIVADSQVDEYRWHGKWNKTHAVVTCKDVIDYFYNKYGESRGAQ